MVYFKNFLLSLFFNKTSVCSHEKRHWKLLTDICHQNIIKLFFTHSPTASHKTSIWKSWPKKKKNPFSNSFSNPTGRHKTCSGTFGCVTPKLSLPQADQPTGTTRRDLFGSRLFVFHTSGLFKGTSVWVHTCPGVPDGKDSEAEPGSAANLPSEFLSYSLIPI